DRPGRTARRTPVRPAHVGARRGNGERLSDGPRPRGQRLRRPPATVGTRFAAGPHPAPAGRGRGDLGVRRLAVPAPQRRPRRGRGPGRGALMALLALVLLAICLAEYLHDVDRI